MHAASRVIVGAAGTLLSNRSQTRALAAHLLPECSCHASKASMCTQFAEISGHNYVMQSNAHFDDKHKQEMAGTLRNMWLVPLFAAALDFFMR